MGGFVFLPLKYSCLEQFKVKVKDTVSLLDDAKILTTKKLVSLSKTL